MSWMDATVADDLALLSGLYRATNAVVRELDTRLSRDEGVTFVQAMTLLAIDGYDRPRPRTLSEQLSQQSQTVTGVLDRLERAGFVARRRDMDDRRAVRLELTTSGTALVDRIKTALQGHLDAVVGGMNARKRAVLREQLALLERSVKEQSPAPE
jgi:DNA-binding MarR family transcriptional regulator